MDSLTLFAVQREGRRVPWEVARVNGSGRLDFPPETNLAYILGIGCWCHIIENDIVMDEKLSLAIFFTSQNSTCTGTCTWLALSFKRLRLENQCSLWEALTAQSRGGILESKYAEEYLSKITVIEQILAIIP